MPIRIRDRGTTETLTTSRAKGRALVNGRNGLATVATAFGDQLATARRSLAHQDLDRLYLDVEEQGRRLLEQPNPAELARYRERVRAFVDYVVKHGLRLKSTLTARELHQIVERVDEELLGLGDALLAREQPIMELAAKIDQVNGILLDLRA
jgi:uncharacterized protein YaaR (DUF327 family)